MTPSSRKEMLEGGGPHEPNPPRLANPQCLRRRTQLTGTEISGGGGKERLYLTLHYHHQNDSCIKMGSDESRFNVSLIVRGKVTRQCPQTTTFE